MTDRVEGKTRRRASAENRFKAMFEQAPLGVAMIDSLSGRLKMANRMFARITGRSPDELASIDWMSITHPDDVQADLDQMALMNAGPIPGFQMDNRYLRPDGSIVWISMTIVPLEVEDPAHPHHLCMIEDISKRKQDEKFEEITREALKILNGPWETPEMIRRIVEALKQEISFDAVGIRLREGDDFPYAAQQGFPADFLRAENSLTQRGAGGAACRNADGTLRLECTCGLVLSGMGDRTSPLFTPGGSFWTNDSYPLLSLPAEADPRLQPRNNCIKQHYASIALVPIKTKNEIIGLIQLNNRRKGSFTLETVRFVEGIATHIGEALMRKKAERELRESQQLIQGIINAMPVRVFWKDRELRYLGGNAAFARDAGFTDAGDLVGKDDFQMGWRDQAEIYRADDRQVIARGEPKLLIEEPQTTPEGKSIVLLTSKIPLRDAQGGIAGVLGVYIDITERKLAEEALGKAQKLESLGILAGGIAHDFNNILTAILGNLSLLQPRLKGSGEALEVLNEAQEACGTAQSLSNQLLTFAKGGSPVVAVMDLRPVLTRAATFAARGTNARCVFELGDAPLIAGIDKDQISRVVQNLVLNAAQAMPHGGDIVLRAAHVDLPASGNPRREPGRYVRIAVEDQGGGINPAHLSKIFEPYLSTKGVGRGLGLATSYSIMAKHGGNIGVMLKPEGGSMFILHLPAADPADIVPSSAVPAPPSGKGRILLMDDEPAVARVLKRMLEHIGCRVTTVAEGRAAVDAYRLAMGEGSPYDAIILDLTVRGGMGGLEAMAKLEALDPGVKAIVTSGYANDPVMAEYSDSGFCGVLTKPYRLEDVAEVVGRVVAPRRPDAGLGGT